VHFVVVGVLGFAIVSLVAREPSPRDPGASDPSRARGVEDGVRDDVPIRVSRADLLAFVQSRTGQPDAARTEHDFDALSGAARRDWIDRFVREEALVREARALGLDRDDELIRRHLVRKMEFLTVAALEDALEPDRDALATYHRQHAESWRVPATLTFTHVFARERTRAEALLERLRKDAVAPADALALGDRFLYDRHYVDRTFDEVRSHFGEPFAEALSQASPAPGVDWLGPLRSQHGWHLVALERREAGRLPELDEVEGRVREDLLRMRREAAIDAALAEIVDRYRVELEPGVDPAASLPDSPGSAGGPSSETPDQVPDPDLRSGSDESHGGARDDARG